MPDQRPTDTDADAATDTDHDGPTPSDDGGGPGTDRPDQRIRVGKRADGTPFHLPVERVLTGRLFLTGKSGSGKSNTASVVIEELLDRGFPVAIVDTDGEYYGLKEEYELLHAGADEECDVQVGAEHAEKLATLALEENVPIILDVSGFLDESEASELIRETARHLFAKEKKLKKPFLLVVEEVHEYIPEGGGMDDTGRMLVKVGKRGRKHGLGIVGVSQRPADVKKDFITQANCLVWHRLTWNNDTKVVKRIVGSEYGDAVSELDAGEAFVQADWTDEAVTRVQFRRKRTFDAGATPGLEDFERPELKSVSDGLMGELSAITEQQQRERDRIEELEETLQEKQARIEELEAQLRRARDVSDAAEQVASAVADDLSPEVYQARLGAKNTEIDRLHDRIADLEDRVEKLADSEDPDPASLSAFGPDPDGESGDPETESGPANRKTAGTETEAESEAEAEVKSKAKAVPDDDGNPGTTGPDPVPEANPEEVAAAVADVTGDASTAGSSTDPGRDRESGTGTDAGVSKGDGSGSAAPDGDAAATTAESPVPDPDPASGAGDDGGAATGGIDENEARFFTARDGDAPDPDGLAGDPFSEYESIESYLDDVEDRDGHTPHVDRANGRFRRSGRERTGGSDRRASGTTGADADAGRTDEPTDGTTAGDRSPDGPDAGSKDGADAGSWDENGPETGGDPSQDGDRVAGLLRSEPVAVKLRAAIRGARCNETFAKRILSTLAEDGPLVFEDAAEAADVPPENAYSLLSALRARDLVTRDDDHRYALDLAGMERIVEQAGEGPHHELQGQWEVQ